LARNIIGPARRRKEETTGDGGEDDIGTGGSLGRSEEDGGDVLVHADLGTAHGFAPPPLLFPPVDPFQFHTPMSIKIQVLHDIYSFGITHAISFLCRNNLGRHPTTLMERTTHRHTSPAAHLADDLLLVVIVRLM
jgi:hypothetical protein